MPAVAFTESLAKEYRETFDRAVVRPGRLDEVRRVAARIAAAPAMARYAAVSAVTGVPAEVVGILHSLECGLDFTRHLHNGDPLSARTVRVPAGRPVSGQPPFSWEASAADALRLKKLHQWTDWSVPGIAYVLERYNGFGYRNFHPETVSPYLWSATTAYVAGKYVADGVWSATAASKQCGGMAVLRVMADAGRLAMAPARAASEA